MRKVSAKRTIKKKRKTKALKKVKGADGLYYRRIDPASLVPKQKKKKATKDESWRKEWQGMPEFVQESCTPWRTIKVHFRNQADVRSFMKLIGQKFSRKAPFIWYPALERMLFSNKEYASEY